MLGVVDLFSGCGGMSLGFEMAGFKTVYAVEHDVGASATYRSNFPNTPVLTTDIRKLRPEELIHGQVVGVIGGPPCQGFSVINNYANPNDPRNSLFVDFLRFVNHLRPLFFVMENVEGLLFMRTEEGYFVKDIINTMANNIGYTIHHKVLAADDYGVPQIRKRVIFIAMRKDIEHQKKHIYPCKKTVFNKVSVWDAISDLPDIEYGKTTYQYTKNTNNKYQETMRNLCSLIHNHTIIKHRLDTIELMSTIKFGQCRRDVEPKFPYKRAYIRLMPNKPGFTICGKNQFIHPYENRLLSYRETARIQSFPDRFVFHSAFGGLDIQRQIGNAVPPLLAYAIAENLKKHLNL